MQSRSFVLRFPLPGIDRILCLCQMHHDGIKKRLSERQPPK
mgnify:FL=1|jgi:hypothetical protein